MGPGRAPEALQPPQRDGRIPDHRRGRRDGATAFWYDGNRGGLGPYDPFVTAETFHNSDGDECQGDGVLVYPGKQVDQFTTHSIGFVGALASIRLKNFRRGIEDAGYFQLAHAADGAKADAIAKGVLVSVLADAKHGTPTAYAQTGKPWFDARKALADLIPKDAPPVGDAGVDGGAATDGGATLDAGGPDDAGSPGSDGGANGAEGGGDSSGCGCRSTGRASAGSGLGLAVALAVVARRQRLKRSRTRTARRS